MTFPYSLSVVQIHLGPGFGVFLSIISVSGMLYNHTSSVKDEISNVHVLLLGDGGMYDFGKACVVVYCDKGGVDGEVGVAYVLLLQLPPPSKGFWREVSIEVIEVLVSVLHAGITYFCHGAPQHLNMNVTKLIPL